MNSGAVRADETSALDAWSAAYARLLREGRAEFPPACLYYVLELVRHVARTEGPPGPAALVAAFRAATSRDFGPLKDDVLADWSLTRPADLGRAVALLGQAGCLVLDAGDDPVFYAEDVRAFTSDDRLPEATGPLGPPPPGDVP